MCRRPNLNEETYLVARSSGRFGAASQIYRTQKSGRRSARHKSDPRNASLPTAKRLDLNPRPTIPSTFFMEANNPPRRETVMYGKLAI
jgi:hypothetical protein